MKICVTGLRGIPGIIGGVETHCEELLPRIAARAPDLAIEICGRAPYIGDKPYAFRGVDVTPLPSPTGKSTEAILSTWHGLWHARRRGAKIVHIHAIGPALLAPVARLLGLKVIMTHHGADYDRAKWNRFARLMLRLGEQCGVRFAQATICVSPSLREAMAKRFPSARARLRYVPNGATPLPPPEKPDDAILADLGLGRKGFVLAVARLVPEKGLSYLIDAHARAGNAPPLVIAGAEMHGDGHADHLRAKAGPRVRFTGALPRSTLGVLYRHCALFVLPSFHEGLPIAALEAMANGTPMLLSDIPANLDLGLPEKHYFPVGKVEALAERLSDDLSALTVDPAHGADFDWDRIADQTLSVYREVATA